MIADRISLGGRLDRLTVSAIVIGIGVVGFYLADVAPLAGEVQSKSLRVTELSRSAAALSSTTPGAPAAPEARLADFYAQLPGMEESPAFIHRLHQHAREAGLTLDRGEYRLLPAASPGLLRYQILLPVKGSYSQVRGFLKSVMTDLPSLALDGIEFQRDGSAAESIEAQLRFTAFLRAAT